uniref:PIN domain-containing protein n=1 Tax=Mycobacterium sp. D16R24 TaxID=1855656 RepID=UPI0009947AF3
MSTIIVVLDTNAIVRSFDLRSEGWRALLAKKDDWSIRFVVPAVVEMESVKVVRRNWQKDRDRVVGLKLGKFGASSAHQSILESINASIDGYDQTLRNRLIEIGAETVDPPESTSLLALADRASDRRAPYVKPKGVQDNSDDGTRKDGLRDTLIWLSVCELAAGNPSCEVWFVSDNYTDFGDQLESKNPADADGCPFPLHPQLLEDLDGQGARERVFYVRTLERLEQFLAAKFAPLSAENRESLIQQLDIDQLGIQILSAGTELGVDPRAAALPRRTVRASLAAITCSPGELQFDDAAMRAAGSWTAQFRVLADAEVDVEYISSDTDIIPKRLQIGGRVAVSAEGEVLGLTVTSIEALPDDPMRRAWFSGSLQIDPQVM